MTTSIDELNFNPDELKKKYEEERDKRLRLRPQGNAQYVKLEGKFAHYLEDPYTKRQERAPIKADIEVGILGGGFGGLLAAARLIEMGITDIRIFEKGGDFGGTWYWNRYPGAACDVESYVYLPLLEEVGYMPTEKYARAPEIFEHARNIGRKYELYSRALFHTEIKELRFDEDAARWIVGTDRGDVIRAKFFVMASGPLQEPKLPGVPGIETFKKHSFHTSRWDYGYTGGDTSGGLSKLQDKVVGIIGTGATAVQCIPHLGKWSKHLHVFQRTPSSVDVRNDHPTNLEWAKTLTPGWQRKRVFNFTAITSGVPVQEDLINDSWTKIIHLMMSRAKPDMTPEQLGELAQTADYAIMEEARARVDAVVKDRATAEALKPWYNRLCKRPCFHDDYLDTFNRPNVTLVDTGGRGVERISEDALFANGKEYKLDCLVYATGFELAAYTNRAVMPVLGRGGLPLTEKWKDGATTLHGIHVHGFPNFLILSTTQSAWGSNFPHMMDEQARHIAHVIRRVKDRGADTAEASAEAEAAWVAFHEEKAEVMLRVWRECTPSYFNNEGVPSPAIKRDGGFGGGVLGLVDILEQWRAQGDLQGLQLGLK
jgi:cation diffusion facilitator CzcD-associated flavoprotein CzcO